MFKGYIILVLAGIAWSYPDFCGYQVEQVKVVGEHSLLESPFWLESDQSLYFIDHYEPKIYRYDPCEDKVYSAVILGEEKTKLGFMVAVSGFHHRFIVGAGARLILINWDGTNLVANKIGTVAEVDQEVGMTRFDDGKADPRGRIFAGTMRSEEYGSHFGNRLGGHWRFDNGTVTRLRRGVVISNGLTWSLDQTKYYWVDSGDYNLREFDYDVNTGEIWNEQIIYEIPKDFVFDGMTIDENGLLYVACFLGGRILVLDPKTRTKVGEIFIPGVTQTTSVAFGGSDLTDLYVTTANIPYYALGDGANGGLFVVKGLNTKGFQMFLAAEHPTLPQAI